MKVQLTLTTQAANGITMPDVDLANFAESCV